MTSKRVSVRIRREIVERGGLKGVSPKVRAGGIDALSVIGLGMLNTAKQKLQKGGRSGRVYEKYNPRRTHRASAPGEPPKTDTGRLVNSGFHEVDERDLEASIGFDAEHGRYLEHGTSKMDRRPFLGPTAEEWRKKIVAIVKRSIKGRLE